MHVRFSFLIALALAGCQVNLLDASSGGPNDLGSGSGSGSSGAPRECMLDSDCVPAGVKCCDCPTFAVPKTDPTRQACTGVMCPPSQCADNVQAACITGACVLACAPVACPATCGDGYVTDANGCLTCECAVISSHQCTGDSECGRTRSDCCGCQNGGADTSVPTSQIASYDASLMCPAAPSCPGVDTCEPDLAPKCVQGACELAGPLPPNACGRPDLPACPAGEVCKVNLDNAATAQGLGVCMSP